MLLPRLRSFDVVCFQELFETGNQFVHEFLESMYDSGFVHRASIPHAGITTLSRYAIQQTHSHVFASGLFPDSWIPKGVLHTRICNVDIFNTHFQASYAWNKHCLPSVHMHQLNTLRECIRMWVHDYSLVGGDFNMSCPHLDRFSRISPELPTTIDTRECLDHALVAGIRATCRLEPFEISSSGIPWGHLSDHVGLIVNIH